MLPGQIVPSDVKSAKVDNNEPRDSSLGDGYSTDRDISLPTCLNKGNTTYAGSSEGIVDVARNYSLEEVKKQLHMSIDGEVNGGFFNASASADFVHNLEESEYSESFVYRTWIRLRSSVYNINDWEHILNPKGEHFLKDPDMFRYWCGDKYIEQIKWGGLLYVAVKFVFSSREDMQAFNASMSASFGNVFKMSSKLAESTRRINKNGAITIKAVQLGGDTSKLGKILGGNGGVAPIVYCSFDDLNQCKQLLDNVIKYATSTADDNFPTQLKIGGPTIDVAAAQEGLVLQRYEGLGIKIGDSKATPEIKDMRHKLAEALIDTKVNEDRANFLIGRFSYALDYVEKLRSLLKGLYKNDTKITDAGAVCFEDLDNCVENGKSVLKNLQPVNYNLLKQPSEQIVKVTVNGSKSFDDHSRYWLLDTLPPGLKYDLKSGVVSQDSYYYDRAFSSNGAKLDPVPPCGQKNASVILLNSPYSLDRKDTFHDTQYITAFADDDLTIKQQPTCDNNYVVGFIAPGPIQRGGFTGVHGYWNDAYVLTYSAFRYDE